MSEVDPALLANAPARTAALAIKAGWVVRGFVFDLDETDELGEPVYLTRDEAEVGEDGRPLLTPTGRPKVRKVPTDVQKRLHREAVRATTTWEREPVTVTAVWQDGKFLKAWVLRNRRILTGAGASELKRLLATKGAPPDVSTTTTEENAA